VKGMKEEGGVIRRLTSLRYLFVNKKENLVPDSLIYIKPVERF